MKCIFTYFKINWFAAVVIKRETHIDKKKRVAKALI